MNQLIRSVLTPLAIWRDRLLAGFPVATEAGDFLMEPSLAPLVCIIHEGTASGCWECEIAAKMLAAA